MDQTIPAQPETYITWGNEDLKEPVIAWRYTCTDNGDRVSLKPITARGTFTLAALPAGTRLFRGKDQVWPLRFEDGSEHADLQSLR